MPRPAPGPRSLALIVLLVLLPPGAREAAAEPAPRQREWTLAATAMLTESNGDRHDVLAGVPVTPGNIDAKRRVLEDWWGVTDRAGLMDALRSVAASGHRAAFAAAGAQLAALTPAQRRTLEAQRRQDFRLNQVIGVVEQHYARLGATGILGWDLTRFIALCRWGYAAGYLTEQDVWDRMIPVARILRHSFTSWRELGENYLIGRQFWDPEEHVRTGHAYRRTLDRLLADPDSPWNRVPWDVDFGPPDAAPRR